MEASNCEQYVLMELRDAKADNERLSAEIDRLEAQCQILEESANREPSRLEKYITEKGRKAVFESATYAYSTDVTNSDGEAMPFEIWCEECMRDYGRPKWLSTSEFIRFFEPEFREAYDEKLEEE